MATIEEIKEAGRERLRAVQTRKQDYFRLLHTMARFHRYTLEQQVALDLYAPQTASACASSSQWERMGRSVNPNSREIAIPSVDGTSVLAVYDVSSTNGDDAYRNMLWKFEESRDAGIFSETPPANGSVQKKILELASIASRAEGIRDENRALVRDSVAFIVLQRLGYSPAGEIDLASLSLEGTNAEEALRSAGIAAKQILDYTGLYIKRGRRLEDANTFNDTVLRPMVDAQSQIHDGVDAERVEEAGGERRNETVPSGERGSLQREVSDPDGFSDATNADSSVRPSGDGRDGVERPDEQRSHDGNPDAYRGNLSSIDNEFTNASLKAWILENVRDDSEGNDYSRMEDISFREFFARLENGEDIYDILGQNMPNYQNLYRILIAASDAAEQQGNLHGNGWFALIREWEDGYNRMQPAELSDSPMFHLDSNAEDRYLELFSAAERPETVFTVRTRKGFLTNEERIRLRNRLPRFHGFNGYQPNEYFFATREDRDRFVLASEAANAIHVDRQGRDQNQTLSMGLRAWYTSNFPDDELGSELPADVTLSETWQRMQAGEDLYVFTVADSVVRGRILSALSEQLGISYDDAYATFVNGAKEAQKKGESYDDILNESLKQQGEESVRKFQEQRANTDSNAPQRFRYYLHARPASPGAVPNGFLSYDENDTGLSQYGHITYERPLTQKELQDYELWTESDAAFHNYKIPDAEISNADDSRSYEMRSVGLSRLYASYANGKRDLATFLTTLEKVERLPFQTEEGQRAMETVIENFRNFSIQRETELQAARLEASAENYSAEATDAPVEMENGDHGSLNEPASEPETDGASDIGMPEENEAQGDTDIGGGESEASEDDVLESYVTSTSEENGISEELSLSIQTSKEADTSVERSEAAPVGAGREKQAFYANVEAIRSLRRLQAGGASSVDREMDILALRRYTGWGGLSDAFDPSKKAWETEYNLLKDLLSDNEYAAARASTLNAHYTPPEIIQGMWKAVEAMGFQGGNILDPAMGTGRFYAEMPNGILEASRHHLHGVELDPLTAGIASQLNTNTQVRNKGYERTRFPDNSFDLAITNVPFGDYHLYDPSVRGTFLVHDWFAAKMADQVRPGGLVALVTSKGTMDKTNDSARLYLAQRMELVNAVRLPNTAFRDAGTPVVADILLLRKRKQEISIEEAAKEDWVHTEVFHEPTARRGEIPTGNKLYINRYFEKHPEQILGSLRVTIGPHGEETTCYPDEDKPLTAENIAAGLYRSEMEYVPQPELPDLYEIPEPELGTALSFRVNEEGEIVYNTGLEDVVPNFTEAQKERVRAILPVRDAARNCISLQKDANSTEDQIQAAMNQLNQSYDAYYGAYGSIALDGTLRKLIRDDVSYPLLCALENIRNDSELGDVYDGKSEIFTERVITPHVAPTHADSASEALAISISEKGTVDLPYMVSLTGTDMDGILRELLHDSIYLDPEKGQNGRYVLAEEYLSGDVRKKIETAQGKIDEIQKNMEAYATEHIVPIEHLRYRARTPEEHTFIENRNNSVRSSMGYAEGLDYSERRDAYISSRVDDKNFMTAVAGTNHNSAELFSQHYGDDPIAVLDAVYRSSQYYHPGYSNSHMGEQIYFYLQRRIGPHERDAFSYHFLREKIEKNLDRAEEFLAELRNLPRDAFADEYQAFRKDAESRIASFLASDDPYLQHGRDEISLLQKNLRALESVRPADLTADEITARLGTPWIPADDIRAFLREKLNAEDDCQVLYSKYTGEWSISGKGGSAFDNSTATMTYGLGEEHSAFHLAESLLNQKPIRIYETVMLEDGSEKRVLDEKNTQIAQQKADLISAEFKNWIFSDDERRERLVSYYNRHFNNIVPRQYSGQGLSFPGMNPSVELKDHQRSAVALSLFGGNALFAHAVGAGKTFEMASSIMEAKRLGICNKAMMVVPNHLTEQTGAEFQRLYPDAKILVASGEDMKPEKRQEFFAKIALYNWDAVIIGNSRFEQIPMSPSRVETAIKKEIFNLDKALNEIRNSEEGKDSKRFSIKQIESAKKKLEAKLEKIQYANQKKKSSLYFDDLGIDKLVVDEAHYYKNLFTFTHMSNVAGIQSGSNPNKTLDMLLKTQYINELTNYRGIIFATGTPVANSMTELYTMQRYLQPNILENGETRLTTFDAWAAQFGETVTAYELKPEGKGFQQKTRFAKFNNLPELMNMFRLVADIRTSDMLNLPVPKAEYITEKLSPSDAQKRLVDVLQKRAENIHRGNVKPEEDNMLKITGDGKKLALDQRLLDSSLPDDPGSKVNRCVDNVWKIFEETKEDKLTQLIFCDQSTPGDDGWNVYQDIKDKLVARGAKPSEIAFIHDAKNEKQKEALFAKVRSGEVRVLIGSTAKMGVGTNVQDRLVASHDLDVPWRPADLEQRAGRIIRQGNQNQNVKVFRYVTEGTFDAYLWQILENKQRFISQIMTSKSPVRSAEDVDEATLSYAEIKALSIGNPIIKEKLDNDNEIAKLQLAKSNYISNRKALTYDIEVRLPKEIEHYRASVGRLQKDADTVRENTHYKEGGDGKEIFSMIINGTTYTDKKEAGIALSEEAKKGLKGKIDGTFKGLSLSYAINPETATPNIILSGEASYRTAIADDDPMLTIRRMNSLADKISQNLDIMRGRLAEKESALQIAKKEFAKPFEGEARLAECMKKAKDYQALLEKNSDSHPETALGHEDAIELGEEECPTQKKKKNKIAAKGR